MATQHPPEPTLNAAEQSLSESQPATGAAPRIAIIGAGPLGLEAAHYALRSGFSVRLFQETGEIAPRVGEWRHLSLFAQWGDLRTPLGGKIVANLAGKNARLPSATLYPTGEELLRSYFQPLAQALPPNTLWLGHRVVGVTRAYLLPEDFADHPNQRSGHPFRILTRNSSTGEERAWSAEYVVDCTSHDSAPAWIGSGGLPAIGEMGCTHKIIRKIPDFHGKDRAEFASKKTLLLGDGISAATSAILLSELAGSHPGTQFFWAARSDRDLPCVPNASWPATSRCSVTVSKANLLVKSKKPYLAYSKSTHVEEIRYNIEAQKFYVTLQVGRETKRYQFDNVVANVGCRNETPYIKRLLPHEQGFFPIGAPDCDPCADSLRTGHREIRDLFRQITGDSTLDFYGLED